MEDLNEETYTVPSESDPGTFHYVKRLPNNTFSCDCKGFFYYGRCYHCKKVSQGRSARSHIAYGANRMIEQAEHLNAIANRIAARNELNLTDFETAESLWDRIEA